MPATSSIRLCWLSVGCSHPVLMAMTEAIASMPAAAPRQCPIIDLVAFILMWLVLVKALLMALTSATSPTNVLQGRKQTQEQEGDQKAIISKRKNELRKMASVHMTAHDLVQDSNPLSGRPHTLLHAR